MNRITVIAVLASATLLLYILEMVRRRKLREEYSILWLAELFGVDRAFGIGGAICLLVAIVLTIRMRHRLRRDR